MRHSLLVGGVLSFGALMAVACGSSSNGGAPDDRAGSSSGTSGTSGTSGGTSGSSGTSGGTSGTSGNPDGGPEPAALKAGEVVLIGVTKDAQVVYTVKGAGTTRTIEAVPVAGGATATVGTVATDDDVTIAGNTVAFWTEIDAASSVGKISLWSKAGGVKANVAVDAIPGFIAASEDGSRLAFGFNSPGDTVDLAITTAAAPSAVANATTAIVANVNAVSPDCKADFGFVGQIFFSAHCSGTGTTLTAASLITIPNASTTSTTLVNGAAPADALKPIWLADKAGTKLFVTGRENNQARVVTVAGGAVARIENSVRGGILSDDGSKLIYWTGVAAIPGGAAGTDGAIRSAATTANANPANPPPGAVTLVAAPGFPAVGGVTGISADKSRILFRKLARAGASGEITRTDINLIDTTTAAQTPTAIVPTATAFVGGFTATNSHLVFQTELSAAGVGKLKVRGLAAGGVDRDVAAPSLLARPLPTGTKGLFVDNPKQVGDGVTVDVKVFDAAATAAPTTVVAGVEPFFEVSGTKLVYVKPGAAGGLYASDIP